MSGVRIGVRVLALLRLLFGLMIAVYGVAAVGAGMSWPLGAVILIAGIGVVYYSLQLWRLRSWTWKVELGLYGIGAATALWFMIQGGPDTLMYTAAGNALIAILLWQPSAREQFGVE